MAKNPWIAAFLSFLFSGLGQLYVGAVGRALAFAALEVITAFIYLRVNEPVGWALNLIVGVASIADAYKLAKKTVTVRTEKQPEKEKQPDVRVF
jgi:TM2 domain-containing membrane protein YozV